MSESKEFSLEILLSIVSDKCYASYKEIYNLLNFLKGYPLEVREIPDVKKEARKAILGKYDFLYQISCNVIPLSNIDAKAYIERQKKTYGSSFTLSPADLQNDFDNDNSRKLAMQTLQYFIG